MSAKGSTIIVIGTIKQVEPARWTTADGRRPANPQAARHVIFRPVTLEVERYLKGQLPQQQLRVFAWGGSIGKDRFEQYPDYLYTFRVGERVVLFLHLYDPTGIEAGLQGVQFWGPVEHYTITTDNQAVNFYRTVPLQQLLDEITMTLGK
ncbi:MAG: hypothetical protein H0X37_05430 [Herpetosiphonaceae bacterium]|nr:hypothetical protein [Herpetosiphonaceae bacterium]